MHQVGEVRRRRRRDVRNFVGGHDFDKTLLFRWLSGRCRARRRIQRRGRAFLPARIHIALVVHAKINHVFITLDSGRQGLETNVISATITSEHNHGGVMFAFGVEGAADAAGGGGAGFQCGLKNRNLQGTAGLHPTDDRSTGWCRDRHGIRAHGVQDVTHCHCHGTPGACRVPGR